MTHETKSNSLQRGALRRASHPFFVAVITVMIFVALELKGYRLSKLPWYFPVSWGWPKEIFLDPIMVLVLPWNGWVFLVPLLFALYCKARNGILLGLFIGVSLSMGIATTFLRFSEYTVHKFATGVMTYTFIFGVILLLTIILRSLINFVKGRIAR